MIIATFKPGVKMIDAYNLCQKLGYSLEWVIKDGKCKLGMVK